MSNSILVDNYNSPDMQEGTRSSQLSAILRWVGSGAILLSGIIFMLQGVQDLETVIRYWSYIAFIAVLTGVGFGSQLLFSDAKGARLSFGLAALLIPVQFSQLGGMVYALIDGSVTLHQIVDFSSISLSMLLMVGGATIVLALVVCYMAFTILMRSERISLLSLFLVTNSLLLLPARASWLGFAVVAIMAVIYLLLEKNYFKQKSIFNTLEGLAVRALLLFPFLIALVRLFLHVDTLAFSSLLILLMCVFFGNLVVLYCVNKPLRELCLMTCVAIGSFAWAFVVEAMLHDIFMLSIAILIPISISLAFIAKVSNNPNIYRLLSAVIGALLCIHLLSIYGGMIELLIILLVGTAYLTTGIVRREKANTIVGLLVVIASISVLAFTSFNAININVWILLGIAGITLVLASSVIEKYGKKLVTRSHYIWTSLLAW
jgi:hypothetical protein